MLTRYLTLLRFKCTIIQCSHYISLCWGSSLVCTSINYTNFIITLVVHIQQCHWNFFVDKRVFKPLSGFHLQPSMFFRDVTDTNQSESPSGHQQLRFTRNYMGAWKTWRRPPTSSLLLDWSCRSTRRRRLTKCVMKIYISINTNTRKNNKCTFNILS